ncbi:MAG: aldo/keto reductase, partial [Rhodospirillales bacterium]|nr:aldo/keto reductase [Rhodospirillales bacterium]
SEYSLWSRDAEAEVMPTCAELGVSFIAFSPLGRGFLTGSVTGPDDFVGDDRRTTMPRFEADNLRKNVELLRPIEAMAAAKGCTPAQVAMSWVLGSDEPVIPIPGAKSRHHLEDNALALDIAFDAAEREALTRAFPLGVAAGARFDDRQIRQINL